MAKYKVTCVLTKDDSDAGITHIGSHQLRWTVQKAIDEIKRNTTQFYTSVGGVEATVIVRGAPPNEYLTTSPDGKTSNNLLSLPRCS